MALIAHYQFNENVKDSIRLNHGSVISSDGYVKGKVGSAIRLTKPEDQIHIPHDPVISSKIFGNSYNFSITGWVKIRSYANYGVIVAKATSGSWSNSTAGVWTANGNGLRFVIGTNVNGNPEDSSRFVIINSSTLPEDFFHFAAILRGTTMEFWINGELRGVNETGIETLAIERTENTNPITIGTRHLGRNDNSDFDLSGLRFYDHPLSEREIEEENELKVLHYKFNTYQDTHITDSSTYLNNGENFGGEIVEDSKVGVSSIKFDGNMDYINIPYNPNLDLTESITVSVWQKSLSPTWSSFWSNISKYNQFILGRNSSSDEIAFLIHDGAGWRPNNYNNISWDGNIQTELDIMKWNHYVGVYDNNTKKIRLYINAKLAVEYDAEGPPASDTNPIHVAHRQTDPIGTRHLDVITNDLRIYASALSAKKIDRIYKQRFNLDKIGDFLSAEIIEHDGQE